MQFVRGPRNRALLSLMLNGNHRAAFRSFSSEKDPEETGSEPVPEVGKVATWNAGSTGIHWARRKEAIRNAAAEQTKYLEQQEAQKKMGDKEAALIEEKARDNILNTKAFVGSSQGVTAYNLAEKINIPMRELVAKIRDLEGLDPDQEFSLTDYLNKEIVEFIMIEYGKKDIDERTIIKGDLKRRSFTQEQIMEFPERPPVITIMGHVDHGKTTILDYFRKSTIVSQEAGGITQHIGAFSVKLPDGKVVTFLDTPGHEAFCDMRHRGAMVTDLVILVISVSDAIQAQTIESIRHIKDANVPVIVALTKYDKYEPGMKNIEMELMNHGIVTEDMGGEVQCVRISALTGLNMDLLEATISAQAEIMDLRGDVEGPVEAVVLESKKDKNVGFVATVLVQHGVLKLGTYLLSGTVPCKVRSMTDSTGSSLTEAGPSTPVEITGWEEVPFVGTEVLEAPDEKTLKHLVKERERVETLKRTELAREEWVRQTVLSKNKNSKSYKERLVKLGRVYLNKDRYVHHHRPGTQIQDVIREDDDALLHLGRTLNIVLRADVVGSLEAIIQSIARLPMSKVQVSIISKSIGTPTESDLSMASVSNGVVITFNVPTDASVELEAKRMGVRIFSYSVIYHLVSKVQELMLEFLPPIYIYTLTGRAKVMQKFVVQVKGNSASSGQGRKKEKPVAGCIVEEGQIERGGSDLIIRVYRNGTLIHGSTSDEGDETEESIENIRHFKENVRSIASGNECGLTLKSEFCDFLPGDSIEQYSKALKKTTIEDLE